VQRIREKSDEQFIPFGLRLIVFADIILWHQSHCKLKCDRHFSTRANYASRRIPAATTDRHPSNLRWYVFDMQLMKEMTLHPRHPDSIPMAHQTSNPDAQGTGAGDDYTVGSTPSPSPPSTDQAAGGTGAGRQRSKSGTGHLTMQQLNKKRQRATPEQLLVLEEAFILNPSPNAKMREMIADRIRMTERSVQIWFQNRFVVLE
jgi:hypothetical protein